MSETVNHPAHYQGNGLEAITVIKAFGFGFQLGNAFKYMARAGKKDPAKAVEDLRKAIWYIQDFISDLERGSESVKNGEESR